VSVNCIDGSSTEKDSNDHVIGDTSEPQDDANGFPGVNGQPPAEREVVVA
jgi:hypothetical protein